MKKVCMVVYSYYPWDPRVRKEAETLSRNGYQIDVICLRDSNQKHFEKINGVSVHRLNLKIKRGSKARYIYQYGKFFQMSFSKLNKLDKKVDYDIIHVHSLPSYLVFITIVQKIKGKKIILDLHESMPDIFLARFNNKLIACFLSFLERISANYADHVITVSNTLKKIFLDAGVKTDITVIFNVPDTPMSEIKATRPKKIKDKFILNYSGTLIKERGLDVAIKAINIVKDDIPNIYLMIFGSKGEEKNLKKLVKNLKLEKYVYFGGVVSFKDVMKYTKMADIGIIPWYSNRITEVGTPNKLFESISLEKPVIASKTGALYSLMGKNAMFFKPGDSNDLAKTIKLAYKNKSGLKSLGKRAKKIYNKINWNVMEKRLLKIYGD